MPRLQLYTMGPTRYSPHVHVESIPIAVRRMRIYEAGNVLTRDVVRCAPAARGVIIRAY